MRTPKNILSSLGPVPTSLRAKRAGAAGRALMVSVVMLSVGGCVGESPVLCAGATCVSDSAANSGLPPCSFGESPSAICQVDRKSGVFLSPTGRDDAEGTPTRPYLTLARALQSERFKAQGQAFACAGAYAGGARASDLPRVSIIGGFDCTTWAPGAGTTRITTSRQVGLALMRIGAVHLYDLDLRTDDAGSQDGPGASRIALAMADVAKASLARLHLQAGAASAGALGAAALGNPGTSDTEPREVRICANGSWSAGSGALRKEPQIDAYERGTSSSALFVDWDEGSGENAPSVIGKNRTPERGRAGANGAAGVAASLTVGFGELDASLERWTPPAPTVGSSGTPGGGSGIDGSFQASNAGSCGGLGGGSGLGGGVSISVALVRSLAELKDVRLVSSVGGEGGPGSPGNAGEDWAGSAKLAGTAGPAGGGGGGAGGNGGNGGLSIGIYWMQNAPKFNGAEIRDLDTALWHVGPKNASKGGQAGAGGTWGMGGGPRYAGNASVGLAGLPGVVRAAMSPSN